MKNFFRNNGLSLAMLLLFLIFMGGQVVAGRLEFNEELGRHERSPVSLAEYLLSGHFIEATFENWESEFFQMSLYVVFTIFLYQKGSSESNKLPEERSDPFESQIEELEKAQRAALREKYGSPWPLKAGGVWKILYECSLSTALSMLFFLSWILHAYGGWKNENVERSFYGEASVTLWEFVGSNKFWFQTMQNWQSEFVSVGLLVLLSVFLRQKGSSQSKALDAPHPMSEG